MPIFTKRLSPGSGIGKLLVRGVSVALALCALAMVPVRLSAADPQVTNVKANQKLNLLNPLDRNVEITYDLADADSATVKVTLEASSDGGQTWAVPATTLKGTGIIPAVKPGRGLTIEWNAPSDWPGNYSKAMKFRVTASDAQVNLGRPMLESPPNNYRSFLITPTFRWQGVVSATHYRLVVTNSSAEIVMDILTSELVYDPPGSLGRGFFDWKVQALAVDAAGDFSEMRKFEIHSGSWGEF